MEVLLPYTYLGPVDFYKRIMEHGSIVLEKHENFPKQTYRNRCTIYGANGPLDLIIPVLHKSGERSIGDKQISYDEDWQKLHWKSLEAAYRSSPFFEYYEDDFSEVIWKKHKLLIDFNMDLINLMLKFLELEADISFTTEYSAEIDGQDLREEFDPKLERKELPRYSQVFEDRHGFISNLSIVDLIFNQGPRAKDYL